MIRRGSAARRKSAWLRRAGLDIAAGRVLALDTGTLSILGRHREQPVIRRWNDDHHLHDDRKASP